MKIVFSDAETLGDDIALDIFEQFGEVVVYPFTTKEQLKERCDGADILVTNKSICNEETLGDAPTLKLIAVTATGYNTIDLDYVNKHQIAVCNVKGYSTESVTQHTFALLFYLLEKSAYYDEYVKSEHYIADVSFSHFANKFHELCGMTWGIAGLGDIGKRVAQVAESFGCHVIYYSTSGKNHNPEYEQVSFEELLEKSDIISIHAPLNENTKNLFDRNAFDRMKETSILINVGRGPIVNEQDLYDALMEHKIMAAGLDVLCEEPMSADNPLRAFKDSNRLVITPHIAWATVEARHRLMDEIRKNIDAFLKGERRNRVDG